MPKFKAKLRSTSPIMCCLPNEKLHLTSDPKTIFKLITKLQKILKFSTFNFKFSNNLIANVNRHNINQHLLSNHLLPKIRFKFRTKGKKICQ